MNALKNDPLGLWVMGLDLLDMPITPLPEVTPETKLSKDAARCLEYSQGKPLLYFTDYKELCTFFVDVLGWENKRSALLPDLEYPTYSVGKHSSKISFSTAAVAGA